eukprot:101325_1
MNIPGYRFINSLYSALFITGKTTGIIIDVGYYFTKIQAIYNGHIVPEMCGNINIGFYSIVNQFKKLMKERAILDFDEVIEVELNDDQIENAIARTCFVQSSKWNGNNNDDEKEKLQANSVSYEFSVGKQSAFCKIT